MESEAGLTRIGPPPPSLLALARGEEEEKETAGAVSAPAKTRPLLWFCLGLVLGAGGIWGAKCDVAGDVYRARAWVASSLRAVRAAGKSAGNPTRVAIEAPVASVIPTVDVTELPRAREERPQKPSAAPASVATPPTPGAPALPHAPGPR